MKLIKDDILGLLTGLIAGVFITAGLSDMNAKDFWQTIGNLSGGIGTVGLFILGLASFHEWKRKKAIEIAQEEIEKVLSPGRFNSLDSEIKNIKHFHNEFNGDTVKQEEDLLARQNGLNYAINSMLARLYRIKGTRALRSAQPEVEDLISRSEALRREVEALTIKSVNPSTEELAAKAKQLTTDTFNIATTWLEHVLK